MSENFLYITSREYKLMLEANRFQNRAKGVAAFWAMVNCLIEKTPTANDINPGSTDTPKKERLTWYLDTPAQSLNKNNFVLRLREEEEEGETFYKVTLKYRSPDRFISAAPNLECTKAGSKTKFEEDVVPFFSSKFSHSTSIELDKLPLLQTIGDVVKLFPGIKDLKLPQDVRIKTVNGFTAHELVYHPGKFYLGKDNERTKIKCALSFWYLLSKKDRYPLVAEFSFDYDRDEREGFPLTVAQGSKYLFTALQKQSGWLNPDATTKTAYAYSGF